MPDLETDEKAFERVMMHHYKDMFASSRFNGLHGLRYHVVSQVTDRPDILRNNAILTEAMQLAGIKSDQ